MFTAARAVKKWNNNDVLRPIRSSISRMASVLDHKFVYLQPQADGSRYDRHQRELYSHLFDALRLKVPALNVTDEVTNSEGFADSAKDSQD